MNHVIIVYYRFLKYIYIYCQQQLKTMFVGPLLISLFILYDSIIYYCFHV